MSVLDAALALMPMHLLVDATGRIVSTGATLARIIGTPDRFEDAFQPVGPEAGPEEMARAERVFLRTQGASPLVLRGRALPTGDGGTLFSLGFGIGLIDAIRNHALTDRDFAPADLAMELLFLHEANNAMTDELSRANLRLEEARSKAEAEAFTDPLTGLFNRRGLELAFETLRQGAVHSPPRHFALGVLDLDHFKVLNDTRGHAAGDEMLRQIAARLDAVTRAVDICARTGGDEFLILLPGMHDPAKVQALGQRMIEAVERPVEIGGVDCAVSVSIGFALSPDYDMPTLERMQVDADTALYAAKRAGRGRALLADPVRDTLPGGAA